MTAAPQSFHGYQLALAWEKLVEIHAIDDFYQQEIGWSHPPKNVLDWLQSRAPAEEWIADSSRTREREYRSYMLRHGHIFHDLLGDFSARQKAFWSHPEDIWLLHIWQETFAIWHYGQYNFLDRHALFFEKGNQRRSWFALCSLTIHIEVSMKPQRRERRHQRSRSERGEWCQM